MEGCKQFRRLLEGSRVGFLTWISSGADACAIQIHGQVTPSAYEFSD